MKINKKITLLFLVIPLSTLADVSVYLKQDSNFVVQERSGNKEIFTIKSEGGLSLPHYSGHAELTKSVEVGECYWNTTDNAMFYATAPGSNGSNAQWPNPPVIPPTSGTGPGDIQTTARKSCLTLLEGGQTKSKMYWIDPNEGSTDDAFEAFCDMSTDGVEAGQLLISKIGQQPANR